MRLGCKLSAYMLARARSASCDAMPYHFSFGSRFASKRCLREAAVRRETTEALVCATDVAFSSSTVT